MTSEVNTVGPPHTLLRVNGSFVNDASDRTEPPLALDVVIQRHSQLGGPSLCQLAHQLLCKVLHTDRKCDKNTSCMASSSARSASPDPGHRSSLKRGCLCKAGWGTSDNGSSQHRGWATAQRCTHIPSLLQSQELTCVSVRYLCPPRRAWSQG